MFRKYTNRGQVGEGLTWFVATLIIIVILFISFFIAIGLATLKKITLSDSHSLILESQTTDLLAVKSVSAYLLSAESSQDQTIYTTLKNEKTILPVNFPKTFGQRVFSFLYEKSFLYIQEGSNTLLNGVLFNADLPDSTLADTTLPIPVPNSDTLDIYFYLDAQRSNSVLFNIERSVLSKL